MCDWTLIWHSDHTCNFDTKNRCEIICVRRDPKVLRRVSWILNKEGLHFANLFYIFE
jgi:hypothetical protein